MNTPTLSLPFPIPSGERMKVRGRTPCLLTQTPLYERGIDRTEKEIKQALAYGKRCKEECEVNKSFARHPISCLTDREKKEKIVGNG